MVRVAFCGIDGSGKSTTLAAVQSHLVGTQTRRWKANTYLFRGCVERALRMQSHDWVSGWKAGVWSAAASFDFLTALLSSGVLRSRRGEVCLLDRWSDCFVVYSRCVQGTALTRAMVEIAFALVPPTDVTFFFDEEPSECWRRIQIRGPVVDESEPMLVQFSRGYKEHTGWNTRRVVRIPPGLTVNEVVELCLRTIEEFVL